MPSCDGNLTVTTIHHYHHIRQEITMPKNPYRPFRQANDRDAVLHILGPMKRTHNVSGREFREIRARCGYSAREFAEFLSEINAPITTARSVYRLDDMTVVPARYVDALHAFVGTANFKNELKRLAIEERRKEEETAARQSAMGR
jgi:hypothetical protein